MKEICSAVLVLLERSPIASHGSSASGCRERRGRSASQTRSSAAVFILAARTVDNRSCLAVGRFPALLGVDSLEHMAHYARVDSDVLAPLHMDCRSELSYHPIEAGLNVTEAC